MVNKELKKRRIILGIGALSVISLSFGGVLLANYRLKTDEIAFNDVSNGDYFYEAADWAVENGLVKSINNTFGGNNSVSRGEMANILWKYLGKGKQFENCATSFKDIDGSIYKEEITKLSCLAKANGADYIGYSENEFNPGSDINRGQFITMLWKVLGEPASAPSSKVFTDVIDTPFERAVNWASSINIMNGYTDTFFGCKDPLLKKQIVTILYRYNQYKAKNPSYIENNNAVENNIVNAKQEETDLDFKLLSLVNRENDSNFLFSPFSIKTALMMVKSGATGKTYEEINRVLPDDNVANINVRDRINSANALFLKNTFSDKVTENFKTTLFSRYGADLLVDSFNSAEPINRWANEKTKGMIPKVMDNVPEDFVFGLTNALYLDIEWNIPFDSDDTKSETFYVNGTSKNVQMMHDYYLTYSGVKYIDNENEKGIILPYAQYTSDGERYYEWYTDENAETVDLEFIAILPNDKINIKDYISNDFNSNYFENVVANAKTIKSDMDADGGEELHLSLPRFKYDYDFANFKDTLKELGINDAFSKTNASFKNITDRQVYIDTAIHKTHIDLNESGTKAAAITHFGFSGVTSAMPVSRNKIYINFNHPFLYMIREKKTGTILFTGVVYDPTY